MAVNSFNAQNPPVTTKGDVFTFSTIPTRLGVGADNTVLTADSTAATGLKWATPAGASFNYQSIASSTTTGQSSITFSSLSGKDSFIIRYAIYDDTNDVRIGIRLNSDTGNNYIYSAGAHRSTTSAGAEYYNSYGGGDTGQFRNAMSTVDPANNNTASGIIFLSGCSNTGWKTMLWQEWQGASCWASSQGIYMGSSAITSITLRDILGNTWDGGVNIAVYGA